MTCFRQGQRSRMFYSFHVYRGRKDEPKGFTWRDYRDLFVRAHTHSSMLRSYLSGTTSALT
ncbi:hypothetical protein ACIQZO_37735 [Streptomyces sp. NPDC097617]|uniref:hypothetical protein n=1 Tax=Streptomyces sp. NPDC097617 TaxID=3366091 RepID=UPI00382CA456